MSESVANNPVQIPLECRPKREFQAYEHAWDFILECQDGNIKVIKRAMMNSSQTLAKLMEDCEKAIPLEDFTAKPILPILKYIHRSHETSFPELTSYSNPSSDDLELIKFCFRYDVFWIDMMRLITIKMMEIRDKQDQELLKFRPLNMGSTCSQISSPFSAGFEDLLRLFHFPFDMVIKHCNLLLKFKVSLRNVEPFWQFKESTDLLKKLWTDYAIGIECVYNPLFLLSENQGEKINVIVRYHQVIYDTYRDKFDEWNFDFQVRACSRVNFGGIV